MYIHLYENLMKVPLEETKFFAWNVVNDKGKISIVEKNCFLCKEDIARGMAAIKMSGQRGGHDILAFPINELCQHFNTEVDRCFDTSFIHFNKDVLREEWNKQVDSLKLSKEIPVFLYGMKLNDFSELLEYIKTNNLEFEEIYLRTKNDNIEICIFCEEAYKDEIEFLVNEETIPTLSPYVLDSYWDEGILGTISLEKFNQYIKDFGGIDLINTSLYIREQKTEEGLKALGESIENVQNDAAQKFLMLDFFMGGKGFNEIKLCLLPLLTNFSGRYVYELFVDKKIVAYEIIDEDDDFWYTEKGKFAKNNILEISQFNPNRFDSIYSDDLDKLINAFNNNLEKFYIL